MDQYIEDLCEVIQNGIMENTYKMVWIRSIVETCVLDPSSTEIHFDQLSQKIFGYYWNQTIYFDLKQSPNPKKKPEIYQIVVEEINRYQTQFGYQPVWFSRIEDELTIPIQRISSVLKKDVCWSRKYGWPLRQINFPEQATKDSFVYISEPGTSTSIFVLFSVTADPTLRSLKKSSLITVSYTHLTLPTILLV